MVPVTVFATQLLLVLLVLPQWQLPFPFPLPGINVNTTGHICSEKCVCSYENYESKMMCVGNTPPHTIPRAPPYVNYVILGQMQLGYITREMTTNLTFCHLTELVLVACNITGISEDAFEVLLFLEALTWRQDDYPGLKSIESNLTYLILYGGINYVIEPEMFRKLRNLGNLYFCLMGWETFDLSVLSTIDTLTTLDLSINQLTDIKAGRFLPTNLEGLFLRNNRLTTVPRLCTENTTSALKMLDLSDNDVQFLDNSALSCFKHLMILDISGNKLLTLTDNVFAYLPNLLILYISRMSWLMKIDQFAFNSSSLRHLYFTDNSQIYSVFIQNPRTVFKYAPNLELLDMSGTYIFDKIEAAVLFENLKNIRNLTLIKVNLNIMPSGIFQKLTHLIHLDLSNNSLSPWNRSVFENVSSIRVLYLRNCQIQVITEDSFPLEFRLHLNTIDLSANRFRCTCDLLWFITWMDEVIKNKSINFQNLSDYECYKHTPVERLSSFHPTAALCRVKDTYVTFLTIILSLALVLIVAGLVIYRYRWYILYWISLLRRRKQHDQPLVDYRYDGFVSYSNPDLDWVLEELLPFLEDEVGLKLCEHGRDFQAGKYIVDNVIEAVDNSRKTILVISNEYMKSAWCQFELKMVLSSYLHNEVDIVVILLDHIEARHMTSSLRALMVSTTYLEWSEEEEARRLFREKLKNAMTDRL